MKICSRSLAEGPKNEVCFVLSVSSLEVGRKKRYINNSYLYRMKYLTQVTL